MPVISLDFTEGEICHVIEGKLMIDAGVLFSELSNQLGMETGFGEGNQWIVGGYK